MVLSIEEWWDEVALGGVGMSVRACLGLVILSHAKPFRSKRDVSTPRRSPAPQLEASPPLPRSWDICIILHQLCRVFTRRHFNGCVIGSLFIDPSSGAQSITLFTKPVLLSSMDIMSCLPRFMFAGLALLCRPLLRCHCV